MGMIPSRQKVNMQKWCLTPFFQLAASLAGDPQPRYAMG